MLLFKTILAALGIGGCLDPKDVDILDDVVDEFILIEQTIEDSFDK